MDIDLDELDKAVNKVKKQINLECNIHPLIDEDLLRIRREQEAEAKAANLKLSEEVHQEVARLDMTIHNELKDIAGTFPDEVSLLCNMSIKFFQAVPEFDFREEEQTDNPRMRFYGTLKLNGYLVGKGYGSNKKCVKNVAARLALINLTPTLYA